MNPIDANKEVVQRFNFEFLEKGNVAVLDELIADNFINHTAAMGIANDKSGLIHFMEKIIRPAFSDLRVEIQEQIGENDLVVTRKSIYGTHTGEIMGISPTGKSIEFNIIDIVRVVNGKYAEHWGSGNIPVVIQSLANK